VRSRNFTAEDREYFYGRYVALCKEGLKLSIIAERLGLPYSTLRDIVDRTEGKGRFRGHGRSKTIIDGRLAPESRKNNSGGGGQCISS